MALASAPTLRRGVQVVGVGIRAEPRWFALAVTGSALYGVMTAATASVVGRVTREHVTPAVEAGRVTAEQLLAIGGWVAGAVVLTVLGVVVRRAAAGATMYNVGARFRRQVTRQYLRLPLAWHHRHPSGQLLSTANADVDATWNVFAPLPMALGVVVMLAVGIVQMLLVDVAMALVGLAVFPALFAANVVFQRAMAPRASRAQELRGEVSQVAHESVEAALVVKALGRESEETERFAAVAARLRDANVDVGRTRGVFDPVIESVPALGTLAILAVGTARVADGAVEPADVVQMAYLISILAFPVRALGWVLGELPRTVVGWERLEAVLSARGGLTFGTGRLRGAGPAAVRLDAVDYSYDGAPRMGRHPAVRRVTLHVAAGSTTALVGPTGSGKSTLVGLVLRLVDPDRGTVVLDDVPVGALARGELARAAALVAQESFLFDDTVRGNVTLGAEVADDDVWRALEAAHASGFVRRLPTGLDTRVGERGASLSGGQRQRLALARALVRQPRLLVLDDATSAVDPSVEQSILSSLRAASSGTTVLVVAYRLATITLADEVVYLEHGQVLDRGSHAELLARCAGYQRLVTAYAREAAERGAVAADEEPVR